MSRPDLYDYIGLSVLALILCLWTAHFIWPDGFLPPSAAPIGSEIGAPIGGSFIGKGLP